MKGAVLPGDSKTLNDVLGRGAETLKMANPKANLHTCLGERAHQNTGVNRISKHKWIQKAGL